MPTNVLPGHASLTHLGDMRLEAMWTQETTVTTNEGDDDGTTYGDDRAHRFSLAISPIDYSSTGHHVMEKEMLPQQKNFNIHEEPVGREAQVVEFDLRSHLKDIYSEDIVANKTFGNYPVSVSLIAYSDDGSVLGEAKFITTNHTADSSAISPHILIPLDRPSKPTINHKISGDNTITLTFNVDSAGVLLQEKDRVLVMVQEADPQSQDHTDFGISQYFLPCTITRGTPSTR